MRRILCIFTFLALAGSMTASGVEHSIHIKVYPRARQQLDSARELIAKVGLNPPDREEDIHQAVAAAVASLEVVSKRWPADTASIAEAYVLEGQMLVEPPARAYPSAEDVARRGLASIGSRPEAALLNRILGQSLQGLKRTAEAEQAFREAERHPRFHDLTPLEQLSVFQAAGQFFDQLHDGKEAAKHYRSASHIARLSDLTHMSLLLASLERSAETDPQNAKGDMADLQQLLNESRQKNYSNPGDLAALRGYEEALNRFKKKLH